ncbi:asparagine synthase-related protein [Halorientalis marina]|uniref:asparagine synthase-related protein n=1 Tax=Halorientalis marina TaxID=2931976 RepID=UPI001FF2622C|nr:asparagine synthase-related protein [Halorientalis marina]
MTGSSLEIMLEGMRSESWYGRERLEASPMGTGLVTHGKRDPTGTETLSDGSRFLAIYGTLTNRSELGWSLRDTCDRVLSEPKQALKVLDGPFILVVADATADRLVVATDKLGTRRCYFTNEERFVFGTSVEPLLTHVSSPTIDHRGLIDLVTIGQVWGGRTLIEEAQSMPPGTVLVYDGETENVTLNRYWEQSFDDSAPPSVSDLTTEYRRVIRDIAGTVGTDQQIGVWLSGGLDSRTMAAALCRHRNLRTYTYDANPPTGTNPELAGRVADTLGVPNEQVTLSADRFVPVLEDGIEIVDGMIPWTAFLNLSASFQLPDQPDIMLEGSGQGGLLGNDVWQSDLERGTSPADALYRSHHFVDKETSKDLLSVGIDPMRTYEEETRIGGATEFNGQVLGAYRRNFYPYGEFASNAVARSQTGTRVPFADGKFLRMVSRLPRDARTGSIPFTRGVVPYGTARFKLGLARELNSGLERIPYERTGVPPARPLWQHAAGFVLTTAVDRLRGEATYGGDTLAGEWYRHHDGLRRRVNALIDDVCDREWASEDAIRHLQQQHLDGVTDHSKPLSCLTTAEHWIQTVLDK